MIEAQRSKKIVVAAALAALGAIGTVGFTRRMTRTSREIDELRTELSTVQQKAALPPVVIQQLRAEPGAQPVVPSAPAPESNVASAGTDDPTREERDRHLKLLNESRLELYDKTFVTELPDPTWSEGAARAIQDKYAGPEFQALSMSATCKATMCKIDFSYSDPVAGTRAARDLSASDPWPTRRFTHIDQEKQQGVSYLSRPGNGLPPDLSPP
jgi:hypothetical protein